MKVTTVLADSSRVFIEGLKCVLKDMPGFSFEILRTVFSGLELDDILKNSQIDLLILGLNLPGKDGIEILKELKSKNSKIKTIALTSYSDRKVVKKAFDSGVNGYVLKTASLEELFKAIKKVISGGKYLEEDLFLARPTKERLGINNINKSYFSDGFVEKHRLTKREKEVLGLISQALSNKEVGEQLFISHETVGVHRKNIMRKLGVCNTAALLKTAYENKLI